MKEIAYEQTELLDKLFISDQYKKRESDVIYKVRFKFEADYKDNAYINDIEQLKKGQLTN